VGWIQQMNDEEYCGLNAAILKFTFEERKAKKRLRGNTDQECLSLQRSKHVLQREE